MAGHELDRRGRRPLKTNQDSISHGELEGPAGVLSSACPFLLVALPCYGGSSSDSLGSPAAKPLGRTFTQFDAHFERKRN